MFMQVDERINIKIDTIFFQQMYLLITKSETYTNILNTIIFLKYEYIIKVNLILEV